MDDVVLWIVIAGCVWAVTERCVPTGIAGSAGLMLVACGCLAALDDTSYITRAFSLRSWGLALITLSSVWRLMLRPWVLRTGMQRRTIHAMAHFLGVERRRFPRDHHGA